MKPSFWVGIDLSFKDRAEETKRAIAIFWVIGYRIRCEVMPFIEYIVGKNIKTYLIISKKLTDEEFETIIGALFRIPLIYVNRKLQEINDELTAGKILIFLYQLIDMKYNIDIKEMSELEKLVMSDEGSVMLSRVMGKVCEAINHTDPFLALRFMPLAEKLMTIGLETTDLFCTCDEEDIKKWMQLNME